ncbi:hypothetical protein [uncultured Microbacterium sp.]|uniref:DUF7927 domain-containing protein n=1 Tax=uncultured Microbacterium sp. TaxID=191216 RepID=UPI0025F75145|nr:hypothetical protein [uncultured Microbacterium sp.]
MLSSLLAFGLVAATLSAGVVSADVSPAAADPGNPGTPSAPTVVYNENFENTGPNQIPLTSYTGATGATYTAQGLWLDNSDCNGIVTTGTASFPAGNCNQGPIPDQVRQSLLNLVKNLGAYNGRGDNNHAVAAMTQTQDVPPNQVEFRTNQRIPFSGSNRFIAFSVDVAAICGDGGSNFVQPQLAFSYVNADGSERSATNGSLNVCAGRTSGIAVGTLSSNQALLYSGDSVGLIMRNVTGGGSRGNDHAFDDIKILDVTPQLDKSFSPAVQRTGDTSTLTFTVTNTSERGAKSGWGFTDNLPAGLTLANGSVGGSCSATTSAQAGGTSIDVRNGTLREGETSCTITVQVTAAKQGSFQNCPEANVSVVGLNQPACATVEFFNPTYSVAKSADKPVMTEGDKLTYSVTVRNTGRVGYSEARPASFSDDLSKVLDDATYNGDASNGATVTGTSLSWSGPLAAGETKTITYSVTVNKPDEGDLLLDNVVSPDTSIGGSCDPDLTCATSTPVKRYKVDKTADKKKVGAGETVTYTITVSNTGKVAYTEQSPASFDDDLSKVTDDAVYNDDATNGATVNGDVLSWAGPLAVGETKTITYSVTVNNPDTGDKVLENAVVPTGDGPEPPPEPIIIPVLSYTVEKTGDKTEVNPGEVVTYTVTVTNTGEADYTAEQPASFTDDLSKVTDDATYNGDATNGATVEGNTLSWSGPLAKGETKTITYSFTVNKPATGDRKLENAVVPKGPGHQPTPPPPFITKVGTYSVEKAVDKTLAKTGDRVTYTITVTNTGQLDYTDAKPASFTDDLSKVTDDATYNGDVTNGAVVSGNTLSWKGALAVGETKTIVYSFTVNAPDTGDNVLSNAVVPTGPGGDCTGACATRTSVTPPGLLAATGGMILAIAPAWPWIGLGVAGFAVLIALGMARVRRVRLDDGSVG